MEILHITVSSMPPITILEYVYLEKLKLTTFINKNDTISKAYYISLHLFTCHKKTLLQMAPAFIVRIDDLIVNFCYVNVFSWSKDICKPSDA